MSRQCLCSILFYAYICLMFTAMKNCLYLYPSAKPDLILVPVLTTAFGTNSNALWCTRRYIDIYKQLSSVLKKHLLKQYVTCWRFFLRVAFLLHLELSFTNVLNASIILLVELPLRDWEVAGPILATLYQKMVLKWYMLYPCFARTRKRTLTAMSPFKSEVSRLITSLLHV